MTAFNFVTNFNPKETDSDKWVRVAKQLGFHAWVSKPFGTQFDGMMGFYVERRATDLSDFWDIVRGNDEINRLYNSILRRNRDNSGDNRTVLCVRKQHSKGV